METLQPATADATPYVFSDSERTRLALYRAAVRAGFYTDDLSAADASTTMIVISRAFGQWLAVYVG